MAKSIIMHQTAAGGEPGATRSVTDEYADWLVKKGYARPAAGHPGDHNGAYDTDVAAAVDPTLAANREAPGAAQVTRSLEPDESEAHSKPRVHEATSISLPPEANDPRRAEARKPRSGKE